MKCVDCKDERIAAECPECHGKLCIDHAHTFNGLCFDCYRTLTITTTTIKETVTRLEARL